MDGDAPTHINIPRTRWNGWCRGQYESSRGRAAEAIQKFESGGIKADEKPATGKSPEPAGWKARATVAQSFQFASLGTFQSPFQARGLTGFQSSPGSGSPWAKRTAQPVTAPGKRG